jgi:hypothetical protein
VGLITWNENTGLAEYIRVSAYGYPAMIMFHSLGLAIMVGLSVILSLRVLGMFGAIPFSSLHKLLRIAWIGFIINFVSGSSLFAANATGLIVDPYFLIKMAMVIAGAVLVAIMQSMIKTALVASGNSPTTEASPTLRRLAALAIVAWTIGMVTGRLIAYL